MITIDGIDIKTKYLKICEHLIEVLLRDIQKFIIKRTQDITNEIMEDILHEIRVTADTVEKLVEVENKIDKIRTKENKAVLNEFNDLCKWLFLLYEYNFKCEDELKLTQLLSQQVNSLMSNVDENESRIKNERETLESELKDQVEKFNKNIEKMMDSLKEIKTFPNIHIADKNKEKIDEFVVDLRKYLEEMQEINTKEELIGWPQSEFPKLIEAQNDVRPFETLWNVINEYNTKSYSWNKENIFKMDPEEIEKECKQFLTNSKKLMHIFNKTDTAWKHASETVVKIKDSMEYIPQLKVFCNPGLKQRHWNDVNKILGELKHPITIRPENTNITFRRIMGDKGIHSALSKLEEISDTATKEFNIEKILNKMLDDWENYSAELKSHKDTGTFIVSGIFVEDVQTVLDDQIVKIQTMKGFKYIYFKEL